MRLTTELQDDQQKILIIEKHTSDLTDLIKQAQLKYGNDLYISPQPPTDLSSYDVCFFINPAQVDHALTTKHHKLIFIFLDHKHTALRTAAKIPYAQKHLIKIINIEGGPPYQERDVEKIFWFAFSQTKELFFNFSRLNLQRQPTQIAPAALQRVYRLPFMQYISIKSLPLILLVFIFLFHFFFIPPLLIANYYYYRSIDTLRSKDIASTAGYVQIADANLAVSKTLYSVIKPTYLLFSLSIYPDRYFQLDEAASALVKKVIPLYNNSHLFATLLFKKEKSNDNLNTIAYLKRQIARDISELDQYIRIINQKLPTFTPRLAQMKEGLNQYTKLIDASRKILPLLDPILGSDRPKTYLLLFANNMELRPGGGFIGSFGIVKVNHYTLQELNIYDVYDADGQLKAHIDPPEPIRIYLQQPHWFLRDSAFTPDFIDNYYQAAFFLQKELGLTDIDGGILVTTTAIKNLLAPFGNLYISDFHENVNKDNFYLKAQLYAEKDFFPGSIQKKRFLGAVMTQMLINVENTSLPALATVFKKSLDEKQMTVFFTDKTVQNQLDSLLWSGKLLSPACPQNIKNCITDYVFPVDANLGVNKANFFVSRQNDLRVTVDPDGTINNKYTLTLHNESSNDVFPGGTYKNYLQILLPADAQLRRITKNDTLVEEYDVREDLHKTIGFLVEVKPQTSATIVIEYTSGSLLKHGRVAYQLVVQKQIGSPNSDFHLTVRLPPNIYVVSKNFSPLVKDSTMIYNTSLSADKIFFLELFKD